MLSLGHEADVLDDLGIRALHFVSRFHIKNYDEEGKKMAESLNR